MVGNVEPTAGYGLNEALDSLAGDGKTVVHVAIDGELVGLIAVADELRPDAIGAVERLKQLGFKRIEMLTGYNEQVASAISKRLDIDYRAGLLPEDKITVVQEYQSQGLRTVMIGDGVNDAPALAQADAGIALGVAGSDVAIEVAPVSLMRDDWRAVPELFEIARRTVRVIRLNIGFTAVYNGVGLTLAALGFLPPVLAAAAQSIPDVGILANSSRLLRHNRGSSELPPHEKPSLESLQTESTS
jgi:P-type Cu+ transporter